MAAVGVAVVAFRQAWTASRRDAVALLNETLAAQEIRNAQALKDIDGRYAQSFQEQEDRITREREANARAFEMERERITAALQSESERTAAAFARLDKEIQRLIEEVQRLTARLGQSEELSTRLRQDLDKRTLELAAAIAEVARCNARIGQLEMLLMQASSVVPLPTPPGAVPDA